MAQELGIRHALEALASRLGRWEARLSDVPLTPTLSDDELERRITGFDFAAPRDLSSLVGEVSDLLEQGAIHVNHPRYFGLFSPGVRSSAVVGETLAAAYNAQLAAWHTAPAACALERQTLAFLARRLGFEPDTISANFTTGGAEANLSGVLSALTSAFPRYVELGAGGLGEAPVFYASDQAHDSFVKIAGMIGLGRHALHRIPSDARQRLDVNELRRTLARDRDAGCHPFLVVATAGTTATGAVDPLEEVAAFCRREGLWMHVDAAWGGLAALSDTLRPILHGIALADSVTWDAHKALPVPIGAGMFFCKRRDASAMFAVDTSYIPESPPGRIDSYRSTVQWSRRFIGLKVFLAIAELGADGVAALVEHQSRMGEVLRQELRAARWQLTNDSPLPLVCFTRPHLSPAAASEIVDKVARSGRTWLSEVRLSSENRWLRACVANHRAQPAEIRTLIAALAEACPA